MHHVVILHGLHENGKRPMSQSELANGADVLERNTARGSRGDKSYDNQKITYLSDMADELKTLTAANPPPDPEECSICYEPIEKNDAKGSFCSPCGHHAHWECMNKWLKKSVDGSCPRAQNRGSNPNRIAQTLL